MAAVHLEDMLRAQKKNRKEPTLMFTYVILTGNIIIFNSYTANHFYYNKTNWMH